MKILIRPWKKEDLSSIRRITWESWISTYSSFIPETDLKRYFALHYTESAFLRMFDDPSIQLFIAEWGDRIVGYARLFFNHEENRLTIPSMYLLPEVERKGIGRRLLGAAEKRAAERHLDEVWIGVMVKNRQALGFYRKAGFQFVRQEPFTMGATTVDHLIGYKKLGESPLIDKRTFARFSGEEGMKSLSGLCLELLSEQKKVWQDLRTGYGSLETLREKEVSCQGFSVRLQHNPGRIKSSLAEGSKSSASERRCFLCMDHLPEGQKGILYRREYLILCNPMPVFPSHFTISHLDHRIQAIIEHIESFLQLVSDFGSGWTVLYNGPKCGASAPDHLHFQVAPSGKMPVEKEIREKRRLTLVTQVDGGLLYHGKDLGREIVILEGNEARAIGGMFYRFLNALKKVSFQSEEPMINVAGYYEEGAWRLLIFPRLKHRPEAFYREGKNRVIVSPGVIDMGGVLITPVKRDFDRLDGASVESIFREVSLEREIVKEVFSTFG